MAIHRHLSPVNRHSSRPGDRRCGGPPQFVFPDRLQLLRGVATFCNWVANFVVSQTFPGLLKARGPGPVFIGYAVLGMLAALFVQAFVTETKGRSLEEIEADLQNRGLRGRRRQTRAVATH